MHPLYIDGRCQHKHHHAANPTNRLCPILARCCTCHRTAAFAYILVVVLMTLNMVTTIIPRSVRGLSDFLAAQFAFDMAMAATSPVQAGSGTEIKHVSARLSEATSVGAPLIAKAGLVTASLRPTVVISTIRVLSLHSPMPLLLSLHLLEQT